MFDSLLQVENLLQNPAFVALIVTLIVDLLGYIENKARNSGMPFDKGMAIETLAKYEGFIIMFSTLLPIEQAVFWAFVADVATRLIKRFKPTK